MEKMKVIKKAAVVAAIACVVTAGAGLTMAYFTDTEDVINEFTVGDQDVDIKEPDWDPEDGDGKNMYPGYTVYKNPTVRNVVSDKNGQEPAYTRMVIYILDKNEDLITDKNAIELIKQTIRFDDTYTGSYDEKGTGQKLIQGRIPGYSLKMLEDIPMVNPYFVLDEDRSADNKLVFNYMGPDGDGILDIGEEAVLFTDIVIPTDWNQSQMQLINDFKLDVAHESIQVKGFASQEDAYQALDAEIEEGTVQAVDRNTEQG